MANGGYLEIEKRSWMGTSQGWAGANSVLWNCVKSHVVERALTRRALRPPE